MTYELPAIGKPPDPPPIDKIAVEEHVEILGLGAGARGAKGVYGAGFTD